VAVPLGRVGAGPDDHHQAVHVMGLPREATCEDVARLVSRSGHATRISLHWHQASGLYPLMAQAVVTFATKGTAAAAVAGFSSHGERDRCVYEAGFEAGSGAALTAQPAAFAAKKLENAAMGEDGTFPKTAYVAGLPSSVTEASVSRLFLLHARVHRISIHWDESCGGAAYALVTFAKPGSVTFVARKFNGTLSPFGSDSVLTVEPYKLAFLKRAGTVRPGGAAATAPSTPRHGQKAMASEGTTTKAKGTLRSGRASATAPSTPRHGQKAMAGEGTTSKAKGAKRPGAGAAAPAPPTSRHSA